MNKTNLAKLFRTQSEMAKAMGVTPQYVSRMPDTFETKKLRCWVIGAAVMQGVDVHANKDVFGELPSPDSLPEKKAA